MMVQLMVEQRVFVVKNVEIGRLFQNEFPDRQPPTDMTIYRNVKKIQ